MKFVNTIYTGDNLYILDGMNSGSIDLIYLDPPFNSKRVYVASVDSKATGAGFKDTWTWRDVDEVYFDGMIADYPHLAQFIKTTEVIHGKAMKSYLSYMAQRMVQMRRVLKPTGSLYLHCNPAASHYLKILLDYIFGVKSFKNEIVWCYRTGGASKKAFGRKHDLIYFYTKSDKYSFNISKQKSYLTGRLRHLAKNKTFEDEYGRYQNILFSQTKIKLYMDEKGYYTMATCRDYWNIDAVGRNSKERTGYPTQKPLKLLERIIKTSSNEGDVVLDPFCGCVTTCVAAERLNRKWIGIDVEVKAAELVARRLANGVRLFDDFVHRRDRPQRTDI